MALERIPSDSRYAPIIGFSRAVRAGDLVFLAGISAIDADGVAVGGDDPYLQARECLAKMTAALEAAGADVHDVVHTRMFLVDAAHWQDVGRAHGEVFADARPAATMVVVKELLDPRMLVEIEAIAISPSDA
ncbi:MAG TPA: RidA family protein [Jatrophihabitantaceae bacterium]|nr:RidA family protein [Jatrophihabitantaceae bacterium]